MVHETGRQRAPPAHDVENAIVGERAIIGDAARPRSGVRQRTARIIRCIAGPCRTGAVGHRAGVAQQITVPDVVVRDRAGTGVADVRINRTVVGNRAGVGDARVRRQCTVARNRNGTAGNRTGRGTTAASTTASCRAACFI